MLDDSAKYFWHHAPDNASLTFAAWLHFSSLLKEALTNSWHSYFEHSLAYLFAKKAQSYSTIPMWAYGAQNFMPHMPLIVFSPMHKLCDKITQPQLTRDSLVLKSNDLLLSSI